jgi:hypothetical protein
VGDTIEIHYLLTLMAALRSRLPGRIDAEPARGRCRGAVGAMTTETVIVVAGLAALALAVVAIIVAKVTEKANSIPTS